MCRRWAVNLRLPRTEPVDRLGTARQRPFHFRFLLSRFDRSLERTGVPPWRADLNWSAQALGACQIGGVSSDRSVELSIAVPVALFGSVQSPGHPGVPGRIRRRI
jgi:hypothetical protein